MPRLTIDHQVVEVPEGATILDAARKLGIPIPTLCLGDDGKSPTSCMVCLVKLNTPPRLVPSCIAMAEDGLEVESETDEVHESRRTALELLFGDHLGDCDAPCRTICPAGLNIPKMIRMIRSGRLDEALAIARRDLVLPATLGWICPAPCEKGCRRGDIDIDTDTGEAVAIRLLHRFAGECTPDEPPRPDPTGRRVAIAGAGPAGLAAAYHLLLQGHACTIFDDHTEPGGMLRYGVEEERLPRNVLRAEIAAIKKLGADLHMGVRVGEKPTLEDLRKEFDAVLVAIGAVTEGAHEAVGLKMAGQGIQIDRGTHATPVPGVFAGGSATRPARLAVRAVADGKAMGSSVGEYLAKIPITRKHRRLSVHIGKVTDDEARRFLAEGSPDPRVKPAGGPDAGFTGEEARREAGRCIHCDCRKPESCKLRRYGELYGAHVGRYKAGERRRFEQHIGEGVIYEPGKCIDCGICIRITEAAREPLGLTFIGRGFDVRVGVPFDAPLVEALRQVAAECVKACPTGALAFPDSEE